MKTACKYLQIFFIYVWRRNFPLLLFFSSAYSTWGKKTTFVLESIMSLEVCMQICFVIEEARLLSKELFIFFEVLIY